MSKVQVAGASVNVTVIGTVYNGRSDPIHNDEVGFVVWYGGVGFGYSVGGVAQGQTVPYYPEMLPGQTGNVSGEVSLIPAAGTPPTVSVVISEISYSDNSDAPGCGGQTQVSTTTTTTTSRPTGGGGGGGTSFNPDPNGDGGGTTGAGFGSQ